MRLDVVVYHISRLCVCVFLSAHQDLCRQIPHFTVSLACSSAAEPAAALSGFCHASYVKVPAGLFSGLWAYLGMCHQTFCVQLYLLSVHICHA